MGIERDHLNPRRPSGGSQGIEIRHYSEVGYHQSILRVCDQRHCILGRGSLNGDALPLSGCFDTDFDQQVWYDGEDRSPSTITRLERTRLLCHQ